MRGICYKNTQSNLPRWQSPLHETQPLGYAYETNTHFVHFYGRNDGVFVISPGLTVIEQKKGELEDWVNRIFGAEDITPLENEIGHTIDGIWRPGLHFHDDIYMGLSVTKYQQRSAEQALRILIEKLDELLLYIEPSENGLSSYSHKTRELLILACAEVENQFRALITKANKEPINGNTYNTNDYVLLMLKAFLDDYKITLRNYENVDPLIPFAGWDVDSPTQSLPWYDAYNKTKHDRENSFDVSTLRNAINAVSANVVIYCIRFSPIQLLNETKSLSSIVNQIFEIELVDADTNSFYIPEIELPEDTTNELIVYDSYNSGHYKNWVVNPLVI